MTDYCPGSYSVFLMRAHLVWLTKYRKKILVNEVAEVVREQIREICASEGVSILRGCVGMDHIHLLVSYSPKLVMSKLVQKLKGRTSQKLMMTFQSLQKQYLGQYMWARGYFCRSSGEVTDDILKSYIDGPGDDDSDDTFSIV
jgi:putative transposase